MESGRRFHRQKSYNLEHVVFDHIADRPGIVVEPPPALDPELLRHGDLHTLDVIPVPDWFEKAVSEAKEQKIENGLFTKVVVDPKDPRFRKHSMQSGVQLLRRTKVVPEGLLDNYSSVFHAVRLGERLDNTHKKTWRNRQIMCWAARRAERLLQQFEGFGFFIIAADIAKQLQQLCQGFLIDVTSLLLDTVAYAFFEEFVGPRCPGNANHRYIQATMSDHMIKSRKDFLMG